MHRRRSSPAKPPHPLGGIVIDGSNVIASGSGRATRRLDLAVGWARHWRPDLPVHVFVDASTARRCRPEIQRELRARCEDTTPGRARYAITPRGESADPFVLRHARAHHALVVSNDRYFDHDELRANLLLVQFTLASDVFQVADEATWFRSPGSAVRVPMTDLQCSGPPATPTPDAPPVQ